MTEPETGADDADRAEQEDLLDPPAPATAGDARPLASGEVPEADALDQQLAAQPGEAGRPVALGHREADDADVLDQEIDVPLDEDERVS